MHVGAIALVLLVPLSLPQRRPPAVSYTVELIAPDRIGGTNIVPGGKGRTTAPPLVVAEPAPAPAPPALRVEPIPPAPVQAEAAKAPEPQPEPMKPEPQQVAKKVEPEPVAPPQPEPPKAEAKPKPAEAPPKPDEMVLASKAKKEVPSPAAAKPSPAAAKPSPVAAKPSPVAKASPAAVKPSPATAKQAASPQAVAKAARAQPSPAAAKAASAKAPPAKGAGAPASPGTTAAKQGQGTSDLDARIAAAVKRVEQQVGERGGGLGERPGEQPGGPLSFGPGQGAGGAIVGVEYLLYLNQLHSRLKQNWAWAGRDRDIEAVVHFGILETGEVVDVRIVKSSGDPTFDTSVERAVRAANPLPPPPEAYRKQFADVEFTFTPKSLEM